MHTPILNVLENDLMSLMLTDPLLNTTADPVTTNHLNQSPAALNVAFV
jgi:hypothetical protein